MEESLNHSAPSPHFPTGKKEIRMGILLLILCIFMADHLLYGGLNLGFAVMSLACTAVSVIYLLRSGCRLTLYSSALLVIDVIIAASFVRSDDSFVKFVMLGFLMIGGNLGLVLTSGQNHRSANGLTSLLDAPMAVFSLGLGELPNSFGGLNDARKNAGEFGKKNLAVLTGLAVAIPVLTVLIPLLIRADAAFEGLLGLLPKMDLGEPVAAIVTGVPLACILYTRNAALKHRPKKQAVPTTGKSVSPLTVNTVLIAVGILYLVYLFSQLAYFTGGFSGILPEEFTVAQYARRGFFEMAWLSGINLGIIALSAGLSHRKSGKLSPTTILLCLFIGIVSLFFTATASAKMFLYINSYGLTRLRLLTEVIMLFIALTVCFVLFWLFRPKFAYMKAILLSAMLLGAAISWADADTMVAAYNVGAYQSGRMTSIDVDYLGSLGSGAVPYLQQLTRSNDPHIAAQAKRNLLSLAREHDSADIRSRNIADAQAGKILQNYQAEAEANRLKEEKQQLLVDDIFSSPLLPLCTCTDAESGCRLLQQIFPEINEGKAQVTLSVRENCLYGPHDEPLEAQPFCYDTLLFMEGIGLDTVCISPDYVSFCCSRNESTVLVWTLHPQAAAAYLSGDLHCVQDRWYIMKGTV